MYRLKEEMSRAHSVNM